MSNNTVIKTTRTVYPQIYAYVIPEYAPKEGWIKIGYTERRNVDDRIREQTRTAGIRYDKLWSEPAKFHNSDEWFFDKQLHSYLHKFKQVKRLPNTEWFYYDGQPEQAHADFDDFRCRDVRQVGKELDYKLRAEQEKAVQMTLEYATSHKGGEFLWNAKPRFGKTLTAYDLGRRLEATNVLIVTNRPAIANSWFDDFETFIAWQTDYRFVSTTDSLNERPVLTREDFLGVLGTPDGKDAKCITFISLQDLKGAICFGGFINKLQWVKELNWDLLVIDEAHEGVDTFKTDVAFQNITRKLTLHLSGTPFKAVASGKFSEKQIFNWTYADEQDAKAAWPEESEENNPYEGLPRLNLFSYQMSRMITDEVNKGAEIDGKDIDFAFDLNEFFATGNNGKFIHEAEVSKWLDTLTRNEKYPFSTPQLRAELKHTFWLLNRVASAKALEKLLREHPVFKDFEVVLAAGDGRSDEDDPAATEKSLDRVRKAIKENERTITLSVGQLTTGVTVPEWSGVMMLSNVQSPSLYMQAAFRAQNQWSYAAGGEKQRKESAYVFDFAPERTLIIYDEFANNLSHRTAGGGGTTDDREKNIGLLLNFFPVIAEDSDGKMIELDVRQVLTIPKTIKAQEVVKRGFMSNLLFQNISGIFASAEAREILEQLNPVAPGKVTPGQKSSSIDTQGVEVDDAGSAVVAPAIVLAATNARFGEKLYGDLATAATEAAEENSASLTSTIASTFTYGVMETAKEIARENAVTVAQAEQVVKQNANVLAREVEIVQRQAEIKKAEAEVTFNRELAVAENNAAAVAEAQARYNETQREIDRTFKKDLADKVSEKTTELIQKTTGEILQKAEEKKKISVEDDIRSRLRGFARTIPSFLMAYGDLETTLATFDDNIKDAVFKEVTGITLDQFRALRDTYNFFDPVVFDESVQEFLRKKAELANYFDDSQEEDIFDYIPPQKTNQIFTPKWVVKMMIDKLEEENPGLFADKTKTFADLYVKSGLFLTEIVTHLYKGLEDAIPDKKVRLKHILENQVHGFAPSEIIHAIAKKFVYGDFADIDNSNLQYRDLTEAAKNGEKLKMKFDVVVGNPPYQESQANNNYSEPIYPYFYDLAEESAEKYALISPARFLYGVGATKAEWNKKMLNDPHLKVVYFNQNSADVFPNIDIMGGVAILYRNASVCFEAIGTFSSFSELNSILHKVALADKKLGNFGDIIYVQTKFKLDKLYKDFPNFKNRLGSKGKDRRLRQAVYDTLPEIFLVDRQSDEQIKIYGRQKNERVYKWIDRKFLEIAGNLEAWKVFVPSANGSGAIGEVSSTPVIGQPVIGQPNNGHTQTFISIGNFATEFEALALLKYLKSKFLRTMLGIKKTTQDNKAKETWSKVPLQDFTPQSDIDWTKSIPEIDCQLYAKYGLDEQEIAFIEEKVKAME